MTQTAWAHETADNRRTAYRRVQHDGRYWLMAECQTLIDGKWEGHVSMVPDTPDARWSTGYAE
jgi:hypothetical protein